VINSSFNAGKLYNTYTIISNKNDKKLS